MIMILLVTAYNGMWSRGEDRGIHMVIPRVTANTSGKLACALPMPASLLGLPVTPWWWTRHLEADRRTRHMK